MNALKRLRATSRLSLRELAKNSSVSHKTISLIENDKQKAHLGTLSKLADALSVPIEELLELEDKTASERGSKGGAASKGKPKTKKEEAKPNESE